MKSRNVRNDGPLCVHIYPPLTLPASIQQAQNACRYGRSSRPIFLRTEWRKNGWKYTLLLRWRLFMAWCV